MKIKYSEEVCPHSNNYRCACGFGCRNREFDVEYICPDIGCGYSVKDVEEHIKRKRAMVAAFNKAIKIMPQIDKYQIKGIDCWRIGSDLELHKTWDECTQKDFINEGIKLVDAGFAVGFSEEHGVGNLIIKENGEPEISLWRYGDNTKIPFDTVEGALEWIWDFIGCD